MSNPTNSYMTINVGTGAGTQTVYTVPANLTATLYGANIANKLSTTVTFDITVTRGANTAYILKGVALPPNSGYVFVGAEQKMTLLTGDVLKVISYTDAALDVMVSVVELS